VKKSILSIAILLALLALVFHPAQAQTYLFQVDREVVNFYVNADGTASIDYVYDFTNDPSASPIEFVDVGLPNGSYDMSTVTATIDGKPITDISKADPQNLAGGSYGVTLALHENAFQPGQFGRVHLAVGRIERMVYPGEDPDRPDYASFNFIPNWFGPKYVIGSTDMTVTLHLPDGVQPDEAVYYPPKGGWPGPLQPVSGFDDQDRIYYTWQSDQASAAEEYTFGGGFPASYVPAGAIVRPPLIDPGLLLCVGIGCVFVLVFGWGIYSSFRSAGKRKLAYLPPKIAIEGHGIKRGLTAVEAAILMEQPLDKVLTMILFGVIKKNAASVLTREPLEIQVTRPLPEDLRPYETEFLVAFSEKKGAERRKALQDMFVNIVKGLSEKMKGFSRKETIEYYRSIMDQAWAQVEAANTPEVKAQKYDESLEWTMLDRRFEDRTRDVFRQGPVFVPMWWPRYDPVYRGGMGSAPHVPTVSTPSGQPSMSMPHLPGSDFAASVVNGVQSFGAGVIGDLTGFTGGVTNTTNPVPKTTYSSTRSGGGGGGRSCACACACAGCACACAGGGR